MTTTVTVSAHCSSDKEVRVRIADEDTELTLEAFTLQDGESRQCVVFDARAITVREVLKDA